MTTAAISREAVKRPWGHVRDAMAWIRQNRLQFWLILLIVLMGATIVSLTVQVRGLQPRAEELTRRIYFPVVGHSVPTIRLAAMNGDSITIGEAKPGRAQVLFFLRSSCQFCEQTLPAWKSVAIELQKDPAHRFDVFGVSYSPRDSTEQYVRSHDLPFQVARMEIIKFRRLFRVKAVPMTLVLDDAGRITYMQPGDVSSKAKVDSLLQAAMRTVMPAVPAR